VLLRLAYLTVTNTFAALRLLSMGDRDKDVEILTLRHQIAVLERQLGADTKVRFAPEERALLAALLASLPREGIDPAPDRAATRWADFLRSQADALLAADFIETITLNGQRQYILAVIEHATRRVCVLGTTAHPSANWVIQTMKNLVMDLDDAGCRARFLLRDRDGKFPALMDEVLAEAAIKTVLTGIRMPRMDSIMERWVQSCRRELLDRCLVWNERHLRHALREYEHFYNQHRAHQALNQAAPLRTVPDPITDPTRIIDLNVRRRDRLGGVLHEYSQAA
jgi:transposase InsO family protein